MDRCRSAVSRSRGGSSITRLRRSPSSSFGFKISRSDLSLKAQVDGIDEYRFRQVAEGAKAGCPVSKLLNAEISLEIEFAAG